MDKIFPFQRILKLLINNGLFISNGCIMTIHAIIILKFACIIKMLLHGST